MNPTAIIIGASSGIGREIARQLAGKQFRLGIAARRRHLLETLAAELPQVACFRRMDISSPEESVQIFEEMLQELGRIDFIYFCAGTGSLNPDLAWQLEEETIRVNALGFAALASNAMRFLLKQGHGQLVGITSVAAVRGSSIAPAYGATKAFESQYLEALRIRARRSGKSVYVTEIRPGFVDTAMMKADKPFWVASPLEAAGQIIKAAEARKSLAYVTRRWRLVAWLMNLLPEKIYAKMG